jgi:hypothetical protein
MMDGFRRVARLTRARFALRRPGMSLQLSDIVQVFGWLEAGATLFSTFSRTMIPLRAASVVASIAGGLGAALGGGLAAFVEHAVLLPVSLLRLREMTRLIASVKSASETDLNVEWLEPFMHETHHKDGSIIFGQGDAAEAAFMLVEGTIDLVEIGVSLAPGTLFGEMAMFTQNVQRTATARCRGECRVMKISYSELEQLYFQNPQFGLYLIRLIVRRFEANLDQARQGPWMAGPRLAASEV